MKKLLLAMSVLAAFGSAPAVQAAGEIKFLEVQSVNVWHYMPRVRVHMEALVANLGPTKTVYAHTLFSNGYWLDIPFFYNRPAANGMEVWTADVHGDLDTYGTMLTFALKYTVNGQTYWDNNNGANYKITPDGGVLLAAGINVYNGPYYPGVPVNVGTDNVYTGYVTVRNLAPAKQVKVVYTTDGWATTQTASANYSPAFWTAFYTAGFPPTAISKVANPNAYGVEEWTYSLPVGATATQLHYAISYTVNGQTYWDNNFGRNYSVSLTH